MPHSLTVDGMLRDVYRDVFEQDGRVLDRSVNGWRVRFKCGHDRFVDLAAIEDARTEGDLRRIMQSYSHCIECQPAELSGDDAYWHACTGTPIDVVQ